jgi:hypothetical protein
MAVPDRFRIYLETVKGLNGYLTVYSIFLYSALHNP